MRRLGWHNFDEEVMALHAALKQFLLEPVKEIERMKMEAASMKRFLEDNVISPSTEEGP